MLSLILLQSRSYADIATLLRLGEDDVRARAHAAARGLVASDASLDPDLQERVIDYVLSEQTVSERERTRSILEDDPVARDWASLLADGLSPLAKGKLPAIPGAEPEEPDAPEAPDASEPPDVPKQPDGLEPPARQLVPDNPEPVTAHDDTPAAEPAPRMIATLRPRREPSRAPRGSTRVRLLVPALGALLIVAVIVIVLVASGGGESHDDATTTGNGGQLVLAPAAAGSAAGGSARVQRQPDGLLLLLRGHGLPPNTSSDSYAVWLYNSQSDARLLGFVSPAVGVSGSFTNSAMLPSDAGSFHTLVLTVENVEQPSAPGRIVLRGALRLP